MEDKGKEFINPENHETALKDLHERVMLSDQDDERNWFVPIKVPKSTPPSGMCKDAKKALLNCLRSADCYQKHGYSPRECLNNPMLPGRNEECGKYEKLLSACRWDTIDRKRRFRGARGINYDKQKKDSDRMEL